MPARNSGGDHLDQVVAFLHTHGPATAGRLAEAMGIPYPTLTPRLRRLEADGRAARDQDPVSRQTLWRAAGPVDPPPADPPIAASSANDVTSPHDTVDESRADTADAAPPVSETGISNCATGMLESPSDTPEPDPDTSAEPPAPARRPKGSIAAAILAFTRAHPDQQFKASQLSKALGGTSAGAIANSASKLVIAGELVLVREKPATYQAA